MVTSVLISKPIASQQNDNIDDQALNLATDRLAGQRLQLANILQTSLELPQLMALFFEHVQQLLPLGSLSYNNEKLDGAIELGSSAKHSCHYTLTSSQGNLGELTFSRNKRFSKQELELLELLIGSLICPIRNALLYRDALQSALQDPLTGAGNRIALNNTLDREMGLAHRHQQDLSILVVDIDKFKRINDNYGHNAGDFVLKNVAQQLSDCCRDTDASYRFGGEEFVVLLNKTDQQGALIAAERIRRCIEESSSDYEGNSIAVTISIGVSSLIANDNQKTLFNRADEALYNAKANGRNRVEVAEQTES